MDLDRDLVAAALPGYEIGEEIGRGGWGTVLRGRHLALGREVAIKQLPRSFAEDQSALARFMSEARIIGQLDHPHIVKVYDFVERDGTWLIVMELLGGGTLWDYFSANGTRADQACGIGLAMCSALQVAHDHGILHRDIKPENILFSNEGAARLGDFGIAMEVDLDVRRTRAGEVIGTPTYMSPEQAWGRHLGPGSDVYSLGIVLYEQLAGRVPFPEAQTPVESLIQHARDIPASLSQTAPELPEPIVNTVMAALAKEPGDRYPSAEAFGVALAHACNDAYGQDWLRSSGTILMGGGVISAAALSSRPSTTPPRQPTQSVPALRSDHFAGETRSESGNFVTGSAAPPTPPPVPPSMPAPGPPGGMPPTITPPPMGVPDPGGEDGSPVLTSSGGGRAAALVLVGLLVVLGLAATALVLVRNRNTTDAASYPTTTTWTSTTAQITAPTTLKVVVGDSSTTQAPTTSTITTTIAPTTTSDPRTCKAGQRCIFIDDIKVTDGKYVVTWTAKNFEPSLVLSDHFHAHFFWDTISASQAGLNAEAFGVKAGSWEITDKVPFTGSGEITIAKRPAEAKQLCVTVGNFGHAVVDPTFINCKLIPSG